MSLVSIAINARGCGAANDSLFALTYVSSGTPAVVVFDAHQGLLAGNSTPAWSPSWQPEAA